MPTISQLPVAASVSATDKILLDQSGQTAATTAGALLQGTQPKLTLAPNALLGRVSQGVGGPEPVSVGSGLRLSAGVLVADTSTLATVASVAAAQSSVTYVGDVTGSGTSPVTLTLNSITTPGSYAKVTVNAKGLVTSGGTLAAADIIAGLGYTPVNPSTLVLTGADISNALVLATGSTTPRPLSMRFAERPDVLDYGADPSGVADSAPAFAAAMAAVPTGGSARIVVPRGTYRLASPVNQPAGRKISVEFFEGAMLTGNGYIGVERVDSEQGGFRLSQVSGGFAGFPISIGNPANLPMDYQILQNTPQNSASARVGWGRNYANYNRYSKYSGGIDFAEQSIFSWPRLLDNTSGWGHWEIVTSATFDEDTASRAQLSASSEHSEFDIVNNGPDHGWTYASGIGTPVQGMSMDPWGENGVYGGHILYAYGTVGGFDGGNGTVNQRWVAYPAVHSVGNPGTVPQNSSITLAIDLTAKAVAFLSAQGGVSSVSISAGGGAYTSPPNVVFAGGGGSGAAGTPVLLGGAVVGVTVTSAGSGYAAAPSISFTGGGVPSPNAVTVPLNPDGFRGDVASVAAAIRAANIPMISAAVARWGGTLSRLVVFGTAPGDLGTLTLGGPALVPLGISAQSYTTPRDDTAIAFGQATGVAPGDQFVLNGNLITVGGTGSNSDIAAAITTLNEAGLQADVIAGGRLVLTAFMPQQPAGLVLAQPAGSTTLTKLAITSGTILPPTPPKNFASAMGEVGAPACRTTDAISISATDLAGNVYGPLTVQLSGGAGTGSVADVVASIRTALQIAGLLSSTYATLTVAPQIINCYSHNSGTTAGLVIRNTAGGTVTLANVAGTALDTLGLVAGTYQPGGYSPGSQTIYHAAPDAIAPQGRGVFLGGSSAPDPIVWPHTPMEVRGNFAHGFRTDRASFGDGNALLLGGNQAIGWGIAGPTLTVAAGSLACSAPAILPGLMLTALPSSPSGLPPGSVWNNGGVLSIV